jgi:hypothetical protein
LIYLIILRGVRVNTGSDIVEIMNYKMMYMSVQLPEKYVSIIKPDQAVKLTNYTIPKDTLIGKYNSAIAGNKFRYKNLCWNCLR